MRTWGSRKRSYVASLDDLLLLPATIDTTDLDELSALCPLTTDERAAIAAVCDGARVSHLARELEWTTDRARRVWRDVTRKLSSIAARSGSSAASRWRSAFRSRWGSSLRSSWLERLDSGRRVWTMSAPDGMAEDIIAEERKYAS